MLQRLYCECIENRGRSFAYTVHCVIVVIFCVSCMNKLWSVASTDHVWHLASEAN